MLLTHPGAQAGLRLEPFDYEEGDITAAAGGLDASKVRQSAAVMVTFEDGPSRIRVDGGDPTSTVGLERGHLQEDPLSVGEAVRLRMIRTGATNGKFRAVYYRVA